jgi:hypothetical protein
MQQDVDFCNKIISYIEEFVKNKVVKMVLGHSYCYLTMYGI